MTTITIEVRSPKIRKAFEVLADALGAKIISVDKSKLSGVEKGLDDLAHGRVSSAESADDMVKKILK